MGHNLPENTLRRLLASKGLLRESNLILTPNSEPVEVAKAVLTAHDASELALAAIADYLGVMPVDKHVYLMQIASAVNSKDSARPLPGLDYLRSLNEARVSFKHRGNPPSSQVWHRVTEKVYDYIDQWCRMYLQRSFENVQLEQLLAREVVRGRFQSAKAKYGVEDYKGALEDLALEIVPTTPYPILRGSRTEQAVNLLGYGVHAGDFLRLRQLLPAVELGDESGVLEVKWELRVTGHPGNWTKENVKFCLDSVLDIALKTQNAPWVPRPFRFREIYDDVITPKDEDANLFCVTVHDIGSFRSLRQLCIPNPYATPW